MEVSSQLRAPAALHSEITQVAIELEAKWGSEPIWTFWRTEQFPHNSTRIMNHEYPEHFDARGPASVSPQTQHYIQLQNGRCDVIQLYKSLNCRARGCGRHASYHFAFWKLSPLWLFFSCSEWMVPAALSILLPDNHHARSHKMTSTRRLSLANYPAHTSFRTD